MFLIHNYVLIPRLLLDGKMKRYSAGVILLLVTFFLYEYAAHGARMGLNCLLGFLMLGFNLAIVLLFKYQREQENRKDLDSIRLQEEVRYLKA